MTIKRRKAGHTGARSKAATPKVVQARSSDVGDVTSKPMLIGYARVSSVDQNLALQRDALTEAGCAKIFTEQMSGAVTDRPALHDALEFARSGDTLIVWKLLYSGKPQLGHRHLFSFRLPMSSTWAA